jgi:hypothetical protein
MFRFLFYFFLVVFLNSCTKKEANTYSSFEYLHRSNITLEHLNTSFIEFNDLPSSLIGQAKVSNDTLYFVDQKFTRVLIFDKNLNYLGWKLQKGNGINEIAIGEIDAFAKMSNGNFMFLGGLSDWHIFTSQFEKVGSYIMDNISKRESLRTVSPENPVIYSFVYPKLIVRESKNRIFFNIMAQHPEFNFLDNHNAYYEQSRVLSEMDPITGKTLSIFGRFSPFYKKNDFTLNHVSLLNFDVSEKTGHFYLNFEADPIIYEFDSNFKPIQSFGVLGKNMSPKYKKLATIEDFQKNVDLDRASTHYFTWLEYVEEDDLLFRSYSLGNSENDGLQIYKGNVLIADVSVPKGLKVLGKLGNSFISQPITDEVNDKMIFYTFRLN